MKLIIIPDVHGRNFWKEALSYIESGVPTVFLGDYLDPYEHEGISGCEALYNFSEIIEVKKKNPGVKLLVGNHDCTYIWPELKICRDRCDYSIFDSALSLFKESGDLYLGLRLGSWVLSHAGFNRYWLEDIGRLGISDIAGKEIQTLDKSRIIKPLNYCSWYRGGDDRGGSPVWSDIREYRFTDWEKQIVGHTQQREVPRIEGNTVCLDCRQCFWLDDDEGIRYLRTGEKIKIEN